ncbi:MAG TPA: PTS sugar transporter subunit IIC [Anaerovoracaceae bacterium]|nr:PTS sugar transporter subunit IIC [Anaerovoracaceae bacterium]
MKKFRAFLKRKDIVFSTKRYLQEALSAMALGLFATLLIGLIIKTLGQQTILLIGGEETSLVAIKTIADFLIETGTMAMGLMGAGIGVAVAWGLKAPPLVFFTSVVTGIMGASFGGPAGAFIATAIGAEFGKAVSKETKIDIIITPALTLIMGMLTAKMIGPFVDALMKGLGQLIMKATELQPFMFGIIIAVIVGLTLTAPISSAALCIMLDLTGLAAGAATVGCCAQMVGFAVISYKDNGIGGLLAQGLGTSMLQVPNIVKNPWILVPPTLAGAVLGPLATVIFKMDNIALGAGMGTSGFVGQIGTFTAMGFSMDVLFKVILLHIILPAVLALMFNNVLRKLKKIKNGDCLLEV